MAYTVHISDHIGVHTYIYIIIYIYYIYIHAACQRLAGVDGGAILPAADGLQAAWKGGGGRSPPQQHIWLVSCNAAAAAVGNDSDIII